MSKSKTLSDLQSAQGRRAAGIERLEAVLGRCLTESELSAYQIAWNDGFGDCLEQQKKMLLSLVADSRRIQQQQEVKDIIP